MTHHQIILRHLRAVYPRWVPAHELVKLQTEWGFTGIDGDRRARELATNDERVRKDWHNFVDRTDGAEIGEDRRFTYFRFRPREAKAPSLEVWFEQLSSDH